MEIPIMIVPIQQQKNIETSYGIMDNTMDMILQPLEHARNNACKLSRASPRNVASVARLRGSASDRITGTVPIVQSAHNQFGKNNNCMFT